MTSQSQKPDPNPQAKTHLNYNWRPWSPQIWSQLEKSLELTLKETPKGQKPVAAFDADGTLWDTDLGEAFFRYQIAHAGLKNLPADPWKHYADWKVSGDPRPAYLWLAQISKGCSLKQVRTWAQEAVKKNAPTPIFPDQQKWISMLLKNNVEVFVVTASVKWAVEPGAQLLGIDESHVLGVETAVENGLLTDKAAGYMTYKEGKPEALLQVIKGRKPFFCSGNSTGDTALLKAATHAALALGAARPDSHGEDLYHSELGLREEARKHNWLIHEF